MRIIQKSIEKQFFDGKVIVLVGPRQVGKTTLSENILIKFESEGRKVVRFNCDEPGDREMLHNRDFSYLKNLIGDADIIFIDEGQKVQTIGQTLKILVDNYGNKKQIMVTGSSSFHLLDQTTEPLTGRKYVYMLYPLHMQEIYNDKVSMQKQLQSHLIYGLYPGVVNSSDFSSKATLLMELTTSQLYKDILEFQDVKDSTVIRNLLKALALQIGSEVSYTELSRILGISKNTVERYIDLLEKSYIIFRLSPYATNKRKEISKLKKIYFIDCGIRNALINNFNPLTMRNDAGALWENFLMVERMKKREYHKIYASEYFWRTYDQKEIDLVEEYGGKLYGYEFKWGNKKNPKPPKDWINTYDNAEYKVINQDNWLEFVA